MKCINIFYQHNEKMLVCLQECFALGSHNNFSPTNDELALLDQKVNISS